MSQADSKVVEYQVVAQNPIVDAEQVPDYSEPAGYSKFYCAEELSLGHPLSNEGRFSTVPYVGTCPFQGLLIY